MELRHLRYFVAVAETLNFRQAASNLQMTQPPLSYQIKQLEEELDVRLFERSKRRVELTKAGERFLLEAKAILTQAEQAKSNVRRIGRGEIGSLSVGFVGSVAYQWLPNLLKQFYAQYPNVTINLTEMPTANQLTAIRDQSLDVGFMRPPIQANDLLIETIAEEAMVAALPKTHPLASLKTISLAQLANEAFVCFPRHLGSGSYDLIISACQAAGFSPNIVHEGIQMSTLIGLVSAEIGVALVPASVTVFRHPDVVYVPLENCPYTFQIAMAWQEAHLSQTAMNFIELVQKGSLTDDE